MNVVDHWRVETQGCYVNEGEGVRSVKPFPRFELV